VLAAVSTYAVTSMAATVENYLELMDRPDFTGHDLSSLRAAGAMSFVTKLRSDIRHRWQAATGGASVLRESAYGMTETHTIDTFLTGLGGRRPGPGVPSGLLRAAHARYRAAAERDGQGQEARAGPASRTSGRLTPDGRALPTIPRPRAGPIVKGPSGQEPRGTAEGQAHTMEDTRQAGTDASLAQRDLGTAFADLERDGFCVIEDVLTPGEVAWVRDRLVTVAAAEAAAGTTAARPEGPRNQRVYALTHKGDEFIFLLEHPLLWDLMTHVLGPDFLLSSITANIAGPGGAAMSLHPDQVYIPPPWPPYPLVANIMWMLDDFTPENGATRFVPGSHRAAAGGPVDQARAAEAAPVTGRAGSVLCFDGRVLHQTGANTTADVLRHGVLTYCCRPWIRQQENSSLSIPESLWPQLSDQVRQLAGLKIYAGLGMIDGPAQRGFRYQD